MSSFTRNITRTIKREKNYKGRGTQLGVTNPKAKDTLARKAREVKRG